MLSRRKLSQNWSKGLDISGSRTAVKGTHGFWWGSWLHMVGNVSKNIYRALDTSVEGSGPLHKLRQISKSGEQLGGGDLSDPASAFRLGVV